MSRHYERIIFERQDGVATLRFNYPAKRNAFDPQMREEMAEVVRLVQTDASLRALVLTGVGEHFCSPGQYCGIWPGQCRLARAAVQPAPLAQGPDAAGQAGDCGGGRRGLWRGL